MSTQELTIPQQAEKALAFAETRERLLVLAAESARITEITNAAGYQECHARRMVLKNTRIDIQKVGKEARDDAVKYQKAIIAKEKELVDLIEPEEKRLADLQGAVDRAKELAKQAAEQAERDRVQAINDRFNEIRMLPLGAVNADADAIRDLIDEAELIDPATFPDDMKPAAEYEKRLAITALRASLDRRLQEDQEAERIKSEREELERLRAEQEAVRAEADRLAAAERERVADEQRRQEEQARAEREAIERASREAREEERRRIDAERAEARRKEDEERAAAAEVLRKEQAAAAAERARMEVEKAAAAKAVREAEIANATLLSAADAAVRFLKAEGYGDHMVTMKLAAAVSREPAQQKEAA